MHITVLVQCMGSGNSLCAFMNTETQVPFRVVMYDCNQEEKMLKEIKDKGGSYTQILRLVVEDKDKEDIKERARAIRSKDSKGVMVRPYKKQEQQQCTDDPQGVPPGEPVFGKLHKY